MAVVSISSRGRLVRGTCGFRTLADRSEGFVRWALADMRRSLLAALCFLLIAPVVLGVCLWKASTAKKIYTATVPVAVVDFSKGDEPLPEVMDRLVERVAALTLADSSTFLRAHHWEPGDVVGGARSQFYSVLVSTDQGLASRTHTEFLNHFASAASALNSGTSFEVAEADSPGWSFEVDNSAIVRMTRVSLLSGLLLYGLGLLMVMRSMTQARIRVA